MKQGIKSLNFPDSLTTWSYTFWRKVTSFRVISHGGTWKPFEPLKSSSNIVISKPLLWVLGKRKCTFSKENVLPHNILLIFLRLTLKMKKKGFICSQNYLPNPFHLHWRFPHLPKSDAVFYSFLHTLLSAFRLISEKRYSVAIAPHLSATIWIQLLLFVVICLTPKKTPILVWFRFLNPHDKA